MSLDFRKLQASKASLNASLNGSKALRKSSSNNSGSDNKLLLLCAYKNNIIILNIYLKIVYTQYIINYIVYTIIHTLYLAINHSCLFGEFETEMARHNQLQQQQQHKYHSQHTEMAKCSQSVATPKTSSNVLLIAFLLISIITLLVDMIVIIFDLGSILVVVSGAPGRILKLCDGYSF
eukprot:547045_1